MAAKILLLLALVWLGASEESSKASMGAWLVGTARGMLPESYGFLGNVTDGGLHTWMKLQAPLLNMDKVKSFMVLLKLFASPTLVDNLHRHTERLSQWELPEFFAETGTSAPRDRKLLQSGLYDNIRATPRVNFMFTPEEGSEGSEEEEEAEEVRSPIFMMVNEDEPDFNAYAEGVLLLGVPALLFAVFSLLCCPVFWCAKPCCFGGCKQSKGICCPKKDEFQGYSRQTVVRVKVVLFLSFFFSGYVAIMVVAGSQGITAGTLDIFAAVDDMVAELIARARQVVAILEGLPLTADAGAELEPAIADLESSTDVFDNPRSMVTEYNELRELGYYGVILLPFLLLGLGVLTACCNVRPCAALISMVLVLAVFIMWIMVTLHVVLAVVFGDFCYDLESTIAKANTPDSSTDTPIGFLVACTDDTGGRDNFKELTDEARKAMDEAYASACEALGQMCDNPEVACAEGSPSANSTNSTCDKESVRDFLYAIVTDYDLGCTEDLGACPYAKGVCNETSLPCNDRPITILKCAEKCRQEDIRSLAFTMVSNITTLMLYADTLEYEIIPLLECGFIGDGFLRITSDVCDEFLGGVEAVATGCALIAMLVWIGQCALVLGCKRFISLKKANPDELSEGDDPPKDEGLLGWFAGVPPEESEEEEYSDEGDGGKAGIDKPDAPDTPPPLSDEKSSTNEEVDERKDEKVDENRDEKKDLSPEEKTATDVPPEAPASNDGVQDSKFFAGAGKDEESYSSTQEDVRDQPPPPYGAVQAKDGKSANDSESYEDPEDDGGMLSPARVNPKGFGLMNRTGGGLPPLSKKRSDDTVSVRNEADLDAEGTDSQLSP